MKALSRWTAAALVVCGAITTTGAVACAERDVCPDKPMPLHEPPGSCLRFGVSTPSGPLAVDETAAVTELVGVSPTVQLSFHDFTSIPPIAQLDVVDAAGAASILTWEPWRHLGGDDYDRGAFPMTSIVSGTFDDYLYRWADELRAYGSTVYLRFAHEPNGTWYPWSPTGGTPPEVYVAAWRHLHDLFSSKNVSNVKWVWALNVPVEGEGRPFDVWYPGDAYVDVVGIDGYNWGTGTTGQRWVQPSELFDSSLRQLRELAPGKPLLVTEVGSAEEGGSKADWVEELVAYLDEEPGVAGFVWFDHDKEADWRLSSTAESGHAMRNALREVGLQ